MKTGDDDKSFRFTLSPCGREAAVSAQPLARTREKRLFVLVLASANADRSACVALGW